jgi:hypothetical protein
MHEPMFIKTWYVYIMAPEPISTAYFNNHSRQSVCLYVYPHIVDRQRLIQPVPKDNEYTQQENF